MCGLLLGIIIGVCVIVGFILWGLFSNPSVEDEDYIEDLYFPQGFEEKKEEENNDGSKS